MNYVLRGKITKGFSYQIDDTLSIEGVSADAKATGDAIKEAEERVKAEIDTHKNDSSNPHKVTASQVGARPDTWMPTADDVGARPDTWMPTADDIGARSKNWMPTAQDVGARPDTWTPSAQDVGAVTESQVTALISTTINNTVPTMINDALGVIENGSY
jgi:hypothetical protein